MSRCDSKNHLESGGFKDEQSESSEEGETESKKERERRIREQGEMKKMFYSIDILSQKVGRVNILLGWGQNQAHSSGYN